MNYPQLERLIKVVEDLRDPENGCPWDLKQTNKSLLQFLIEESYEYIYAVENEDWEEAREELGDVLLQVLLHSVVAHQEGKFNLEDVSQTLADKLIYRHPHVFAENSKNITPEEVKVNWEKLKEKEKKEKGLEQQSKIKESILCNPSLLSAYKIGKKSSKINFDWDNVDQVLEKANEEWQEFQDELKSKKLNKNKIEEELGDFFFSMAQLSRHLGIDPEDCTRKANKKFLKRFHKMEELMLKEKASFENMTQAQLDIYWDKVKELEKNKSIILE